ncbi:MAG: hypothetical protein OMM_13305, partial [Candidatus Magnetoglobus multicellularis str. Araruama]
MLVCLTSCGGDDDDSVSTTKDENDIVATETWRSNIANGDGDGEWIFKRKSDGSIFVDGDWVYWGNGAPSKVTCPFTDGIVTFDGTQMSFTASGTASLENSGLTSKFVLNV